jgi:hypothetical protein
MNDPAASPPEDVETCALCGVSIMKNRVQFLNAQPACPACVDQVKNEVAEQKPEAMHYPMAFLGGLVGAALGAAVWAGIAVVTNLEVGYVAILVGFLAGFGVRVAAGKKRSMGMQVMAALLSVVGLLLAKYAVVAHVIVDLAKKEGMAVSYFDPRIFEVFPLALKEMLSPFDALWLILAIGAAYRVPKPSEVNVH